MHHSLHHVLDCAVLAVASITTALSGLVLATAPDAQTAELQLFLLPLIGSVIVSGGMIMLNPSSPETRRIVIGRSIFALFIGVLMPQLVAGLHPWLANVTVKPALLVLVGGITSGAAYVLSKPFCAELYNRSAGSAANLANQLEKKLNSETKPGA